MNFVHWIFAAASSVKYEASVQAHIEKQEKIENSKNKKRNVDTDPNLIKKKRLNHSDLISLEKFDQDKKDYIIASIYFLNIIYTIFVFTLIYYISKILFLSFFYYFILSILSIVFILYKKNTLRNEIFRRFFLYYNIISVHNLIDVNYNHFSIRMNDFFFKFFYNILFKKTNYFFSENILKKYLELENSNKLVVNIKILKQKLSIVFGKFISNFYNNLHLKKIFIFKFLKNVICQNIVKFLLYFIQIFSLFEIITKIRFVRFLLTNIINLILIIYISIKLFISYKKIKKNYNKLLNNRYLGLIDILSVIFTISMDKNIHKLTSTSKGKFKKVDYTYIYNRFLKIRKETPDEIFRKFFTNKYLQTLNENFFSYTIYEYDLDQEIFGKKLRQTITSLKDFQKAALKASIIREKKIIKKRKIKILINKYHRFKKRAKQVIKLKRKNFYLLKNEIPFSLISNNKFRDIYFKEFIIKKFLLRKKTQTMLGMRSLWIKKNLEHFYLNKNVKNIALSNTSLKTEYRNNMLD